MFAQKNSHPDALECATCHDAHGSGQSGLLLDKQPALCGQCHDAASTHSHPFQEPARDPRTGNALVCTSCHNPHGSPHEQLLTHEKRRELCVQCHRGPNLEVRGRGK
jgi:predicted CXXCH cytochrome family protein